VAAAALQLPVDVHHHPRSALARRRRGVEREGGRDRGARGKWRVFELDETCGARRSRAGSGSGGKAAAEASVCAFWAGAERSAFRLVVQLGPRNNCGK
jgi:hypothetical protein